jgi:hypothetical protein
LLAQIARPIPWAAALEANREEHRGHLTPDAFERRGCSPSEAQPSSESLVGTP